MKTLKYKYLKKEINDNTYYYYKIYGTFIECHSHTPFQLFYYYDMIVITSLKPTKIIKECYDCGEVLFNSSNTYEEIEEKDYESKYKELYDTYRKTLAEIGNYFNKKATINDYYYKIKEIKGDKVIMDMVVVSKVKTKMIIKNSVADLSQLFYTTPEKMTEEEWNKLYENLS